MDTVLTYLDGYCERASDPGIFAEPLNAVTNLFFILAAAMVARVLVRTPKVAGATRTDFWLLTCALFAIGIGSGLWHLIPNGTTVLMDVIPITLFIHLYLISAMRRVLGLSWIKTIGWWGVYLLASIFAQITLPPDMLNGTIMYIPTYFTLILLSCAVKKKDAALGKGFMQMLYVWTASLAFRTADMDVCAQLAIGTHFLWHTLNAYMLYRLSILLINGPK